MTESDKITAEGATLADALANAAAALQIDVDDVEFEYDRAHLASGASTVGIIASKRVGGADGGADGDERRKPRRNPARDEVIRGRGRDAVAKVLAGSEQEAVVDLNSYERHLVHTLVRETEGLTSSSVGEGLRKDVIVTRGDPDA